MADTPTTPFGTWAPIYRGAGFWPRPLVGKACKLLNWQTPDPEQPEGRLDQWVKDFPGANIGLLMGSSLPDGTLLGALDIDHDDYVGLGRVLFNDPVCARVGKKGVVYFVRVSPSLSSQKFRVTGKGGEKYGQVAELLFKGNICAIPPSIHPDTHQPYKWIGPSLLEVDLNKLPLIGE